MKPYTVYINGKFVCEKDATVLFNDAGFLYGDGIFETIRFDNKNLFSPKKHIKRLKSGLSLMNINLMVEDIDLIDLLIKMMDINSLDSGLLRLMVTRGEIIGSPWKFNGSPNIYIKIREISTKPRCPVKIVFFNEKKYPIIRFNPAIKSMNYIGNMRAKNDAENLGAYEPVFFNNNLITECAIRNVFFIKNKEIQTPSLDLGVLPGVMRNTIIDISKSLGYKVTECHIKYDEINNMDEAFISSTGIGLLPVYWEKWNSNYEITKKIKKCLDDRISN